MSPVSPLLLRIRWPTLARHRLQFLLVPFVVLALSQGEYIETHYGEIVETFWECLSVVIALAGLGLRGLLKWTPLESVKWDIRDAVNVTRNEPPDDQSESSTPTAEIIANYLLLLGLMMFSQAPWLILLASMLYWLPHVIAVSRLRTRLMVNSDKTNVPRITAVDAGAARAHSTSAFVQEYPIFLGLVAAFTLIEWTGDWLTEENFIADPFWLVILLAALMPYILLKMAGHRVMPAPFELAHGIRANALIPVALVLISSTIWFCNLDYRKLAHPDEGRYAEIPREMSATGDWITPRLNGIKYFEKPPLQYWATAATYKALGEHEWTARLWPALTGFLGVVLVFFTSGRLFGPRAGLYSAILLGSSLLYAGASHVLTVDMGTTFFMGASLCAFLLAQSPRASASNCKRWMYVVWAALALSVLSKGLIGVVLPGAILAAYSILQRDFSAWRRLQLVWGSMIFLAITLPWFVAVSIANPTFFDFFFIHEHFTRFLTRVHGRYQPWWFFIPVLLIGAMPWTLMVLDALRTAWRPRLPVNEFQPKRFLLIWVALIFGFFSLSSSKLPFYILPVFPVLAILTGARLMELSRNRLNSHFKFITGTAAIALLISTQVSQLSHGEVDRALYLSLEHWTVAAALILLLGSGAGWLLLRRGRLSAAFVTLGLSALVAGQLLNTGYNAFSPIKSAYNLAASIKPLLRPNTTIYSIGMYDQTLPYYLGRTVILVGFKGELEFGLAEEPWRAIDNEKDFDRLWRGPSDAVAVMSSEKYAEFKRADLPMKEIKAQSGVVAVGNLGLFASSVRQSSEPSRQ